MTTNYVAFELETEGEAKFSRHPVGDYKAVEKFFETEFYGLSTQISYTEDPGYDDPYDGVKIELSKHIDADGFRYFACLATKLTWNDARRLHAFLGMLIATQATTRNAGLA